MKTKNQEKKIKRTCNCILQTNKMLTQNLTKNKIKIILHESKKLAEELFNQVLNKIYFVIESIIA